MKRYVVGDIHGCYDELVNLLVKIDQHANEQPYKVIFVGDYVDRGPESKSVVIEVMNMQKRGHIALMGNHEDMLLAGDYTYAAETIVSFGGFRGHYIPEHVKEWMKALPKYYEDDTIIVAHAGAKPGVPMSEQSDAMLLWYRYEERGPALMGKHFYHGHTPIRGFVDTREDRTNVDTGCVYDGQLTAAIVGDDGNPEGFIHVPKKGGMYDMSDAESRGWEV